MKKYIFALCFLMFGCSLAQSQVSCRGQVVIKNEYKAGFSPFANTEIEIIQVDARKIERVLIPTMTDFNGYYYFKVYPGKYIVRVNRSRKYEIIVGPLDVSKKQRYFDLPQLIYQARERIKLPLNP